MSIILRPAQAVAIKPSLLALKTAGKALVVMATGLGKTLTAALITKEYAPKKALFLVHNNFILEHAIGEFGKVFDQKKINLARYNGLSKKGVAKANLVFATWQTMRINLSKWNRNHFDLVIVDEAHHTGAETFLPVAEYFNAPKLAITATPHHRDLNIREVFGEEVVNITLEEAIARGWLPRIEYHVITDKSLDEKALQEIVGEIRQGKKRFTMDEVDRRLFIKKREDEIARIIDGYKEKAIVFCRDIKHAERMSDCLTNSKTFHSQKGKGGKSGMKDNLVVLQALQEGSIQKVCAVNAFNEGVDVPSVELIAFCRATSSMTIFRQQLGRGLRPGKGKLMVLDFVGNLERIRLVSGMMNRIADLHEQFTPEGEMDREGYVRQPFEVSGAGFEFTFSDQIVELMEVLNHCEQDLYPTWQEASQATIGLGIKTCQGYRSGQYKEDSRLPSNPHLKYSDFPGWPEFLGKKSTSFYSTWQEASEVAVKLEFKTRVEYKTGYVKDPKLPGSPNSVYKDFPGWGSFLQTGRKHVKDIYLTWQEASSAAINLGITNSEDYQVKYKKDPKLHCNPKGKYSDFPGWGVFLGTGFTQDMLYLTWQEASASAIILKVKSRRDYREKYKQDGRLPCEPQITYSNFPGWKTFLGK